MFRPSRPRRRDGLSLFWNRLAFFGIMQNRFVPRHPPALPLGRCRSYNGFLTDQPLRPPMELVTMTGSMFVRRAALLLLIGWPCASTIAAPAGKINYDRQIRPILSNNCFKCHGPDGQERKAQLRFDTPDGPLAAGESGKKAVVPGKPLESELVRRILSPDPDQQMPPPDSNKKLSDAEKELLKNWIAEGASMELHWAFVAPRRPAVPAVSLLSWPRGAIDRFIVARLDAAGLKPNQDAEKPTLIRRATLDLTGLPPTLAEVDEFLADERPDAYERLIDRLLASVSYGERMAVDWLDAARFADTHGYHIDCGRDMTRWREYVIDAFNGNHPWDQFTIEQLAGDQLPDATDPAENLRRKIASGFNRNNMINFEGGAIPEEYLNAYIVDRVNTVGSIFLGLTVACSQCHDHKYDPLTQKNFYQLYAFFNNVPENGLDGSKGNAMPFIKAPTKRQELRIEVVSAAIQQLQKQLAAPLPAVDAAQQQWEQTALAAAKSIWTLIAPQESQATGGATLTTQSDLSLLVGGKNPAQDKYLIQWTLPADAPAVTSIRLEALPDDSLIARGPGRSENGNIVMTKFRIERQQSDAGKAWTELKIKSAVADFSQVNYAVASALDGKPGQGWAIHPQVGKPHQAVFALAEPIAHTSAVLLRVTLEFQSGFAGHQLGRFRLAFSSLENPPLTDALPAELAVALETPADKRTPAQQATLRGYYREQVSPELRKIRDELAASKKEQAELEKVVPTVMVMQDMPQPRETFVRVRGAYDKLGEKVTAGVPAFLPPLPAGAPANRLGLARWLVDPGHPLMNRVTVNRFWLMFFGAGLVKTAEDFGSQGELPSHPELLDWLATDFASPAEGPAAWDVKRFVRRVVTSSAYRQSAVVTPEKVAKDPENRLLARGARFRLSAEAIRDQALFTGGLLDGRIGGASVSPYQPAGIWEELASRADGKNWTAQEYSQSHGADLYRRTMYTFWKRTAPPPSLLTFDAPDRETCTIRRARTNTPLQALVLMNDPTYVEASRQFAERIIREGGRSVDERLTFAVRSILCRPPTAAELVILRRVYQNQLARFQAAPAAAAKLLTVGEAPRDEKLDAAELAAWAMLASGLLNLDETLTKG